MTDKIDRDSIGHLGVIYSAASMSKRSHVRHLTAEQKSEILRTYKQRYEEYQRKIAKA